MKWWGYHPPNVHIENFNLMAKFYCAISSFRKRIIRASTWVWLHNGLSKLHQFFGPPFGILCPFQQGFKPCIEFSFFGFAKLLLRVLRKRKGRWQEFTPSASYWRIPAWLGRKMWLFASRISSWSPVGLPYSEMKIFLEPCWWRCAAYTKTEPQCASRKSWPQTQPRLSLGPGNEVEIFRHP